MCELLTAVYLLLHISYTPLCFIRVRSGSIYFIQRIVVHCDIDILLSSHVYFPIVFDNDPTFQRKPAIEVP